MSREGFNPGLRLKLGASTGANPGQRPRAEGIETALARALGKAGAPYDGLTLSAQIAPPKWDLPLTEVISALPPGGLICVLEAGQDRRGICALDSSVVDALIEVQTTGRVDRGAGLARAPTKIDAALTRDFIGLFLGALAGELGDVRDVDWPLGLTYGTHLADPRGLDLLLPDHPCHLFSATLDLGEGAKSGTVMLAAPVTGSASPSHGATPATEKWGKPWQEILLTAPATLEAVLLRQTLPLTRLEALQVGDVLSFDRADLAALDICDVQGKRVFKARLGRVGGNRAVNLTTGTGQSPISASAAPPDPPAAAAPPDPPAPVPPPA